MTRFRRLGDWFVRHFGPGPSLYEVQRDLALIRQEWTDMQDWLNKWASRQAKRDERETKRMLESMAPDPAQMPVAASAADHKAELRSRAFALRTGRSSAGEG